MLSNTAVVIQIAPFPVGIVSDHVTDLPPILPDVGQAFSYVPPVGLPSVALQTLFVLQKAKLLNVALGAIPSVA